VSAPEELKIPPDREVVAQQIAEVLTSRRETLAVVETSAGGLISSILTDIAGASDWYVGSAVTYSSSAKQRILGLRSAPAVSESAAMEMAQAGRRVLGADWVLSETGIAGPQSDRRSTKPVGLVAVAVAGPKEHSRELRLDGRNRKENKLAFATAGLTVLLATLQEAK
jgi:PncC family amidohydrolase